MSPGDPHSAAILDALPLHLAVLDGDGKIVHVNNAWRDFGRRNGLTCANAGVGANYLDVCRRSAALGDPYAEEALAGLRELLAGTRSQFAFEYPCDAPTVAGWFRFEASTYRSEGGSGVVVAHLDVTSRRRAELALEQREAMARAEAARLQLLLDLTVDAICCLDVHGTVLSASASAEAIWGRPVDHMVGKNWLELIDAADRNDAFQALSQMQRADRPCTLKTRGARSDGRPLHVEWTAQWSSAQQVTVAVGRDVTALHISSVDRQEAIEALRLNEERFRLIAKATSDAIWEWDAATGNVWWSQGLGGLFSDVAADWQSGWASWERRVHPDDLPGVLERFQRAVDGLDPEFAMEYRFRRQDQSWGQVLARGAFVRDKNGGAVRCLGGLTDVSSLRRAEAEAKRAADVQAFIVTTQQELARPGLRFDELLQIMCDRAMSLTGASGAVVELCESPSQTVTRFTTPSQRRLLGLAVGLPNSFSGAVLQEGRALLCEDCMRDHRVDRILAERAGAAAMIGAPLRRGEEIIGVVKVLADRPGVFSPANVDHLQSLTESLRVILQRLNHEVELARLHRTQRLISLVALAKATIEQEPVFLQKACDLAIEHGAYPAACVIYRDDAAKDSLKAMAHAGPVGKDACHWLIGESQPGRRAVDRALRAAEAVFLTIGEIEDEACRKSVMQSGIHGVVVLPLQREGNAVFGVLALFSAETAPLSDDERTMLRDLSGGMAFGIRHIRAQREKRLLENAVLKVATGVWEKSATEYFEQLCLSVADALEAPAAFVARIVRHSGTPRARTLAGVIDGHLVEPFEYTCEGSPCELLLERDEAVIPYDLGRRYDMSQMRFQDAQAYAGRSLRDSTGAVVGLLIVVWRRALSEIDLTRSLLGVFATRAAFELERRQTEVKLREQASLLDQAKDAIVVRDLQGRIRYWNKGAERLCGWPASDAVGQEIPALLDEDAATRATALERVTAEGQWAGSFEYRHRDGHRVPCETHWTLVRHSEGRGQSILTINTDIGPRLKMEAQLRQSHRLESVGQLTGGVAHDFNNLLTVIMGNAELLTDSLVSQPDLLELAEMVRDAAQRGADLTHQLLAFSRRQTLNPHAVGIDQLVVGLMSLLRRTLPESIRVEHAPGATAPALVDSAQLESALLNLCLNARDAMPRGGRIRITTQDAVLQEGMTGLPVDVRPGPYVRVAVVDEGTGIEPDLLARVIEPFFTTKPVGKGTGLGLSMVYGFAKQSQGHLTIESEVGRGTTVSLYLPRASSPQAREDRTARSHEQRGAESILLVEDDPMVRQFAHGLLSGLGYRVTAAEDGTQALRILEQDAHFDLLFTDVVMPGHITGPDLVEAGRRLRPGLRALYSSGYTENALEDLPKERAAGLLRKPYRRADLAAAIRSALSGPADV